MASEWVFAPTFTIPRFLGRIISEQSPARKARLVQEGSNTECVIIHGGLHQSVTTGDRVYFLKDGKKARDGSPIASDVRKVHVGTISLVPKSDSKNPAGETSLKSEGQDYGFKQLAWQSLKERYKDFKVGDHFTFIWFQGKDGKRFAEIISATASPSHSRSSSRTR